MGTNNIFSLDNLSGNANFDFISKINGGADRQDSDFHHTNLFETNDADSPYSSSNFKCSYLDPIETSTYLCNDNRVSILSINIQSLSAKFGELKEFINMLECKNCSPDIILLQEIWQINNEKLFELPNYHPLVFKCRANAKGGGVGIYIKSLHKFKINTCAIFWERIVESILVDVTIDGQSFTVGSLYRCINHPSLSAKEQFSEFIDLLSNLLNNLATGELILGGDLNIDALKIDSCPIVSSYIDLLYANGFIQSISKPTRCTPTSASCIDHFISNINQQTYESIVIVSKISDHFPVLFLKDQLKKHAKSKIILTRDFSEHNVACFSNQLSSINWDGVTADGDPNSSFDKFSNIFRTLHENFFSLKAKRFNKNINKINPWMTHGLLVSRSTKL
jgi:endonuclease/exonuclease/phosphatase (EEP) superfamily protein YafD